MDIKERWIGVKDHDRYEVSNLGNVRNKKSGRILKPQLNRDGGYLRVNVGGDRDYIHRIVAKSFFDVNDDDFVVRHHDGDKTNNALCNLVIESR